MKARNFFLAVMLTITAFAATADEYWDRKVSLYDSLQVTHDDIVFLGNSITDGGEFSELFGMENVLNRGIVSDIIPGVMKRLDQVTDGHPKKIFLLIGINDVSHGHSVSKLASRYAELVDSIRSKSPETTLYLQSLMPINNDFRRYKNLIGKEKTVKGFNNEIKKIAQSRGLTYIDLWPAMAGHDGKLRREFTNDGLHLKGAGYRAWTDAIRKYVEEP